MTRAKLHTRDDAYVATVLWPQLQPMPGIIQSGARYFLTLGSGDKEGVFWHATRKATTSDKPAA